MMKLTHINLFDDELHIELFAVFNYELYIKTGFCLKVVSKSFELALFTNENALNI